MRQYDHTPCMQNPNIENKSFFNSAISDFPKDEREAAIVEEVVDSLRPFASPHDILLAYSLAIEAAPRPNPDTLSKDDIAKLERVYGLALRYRDRYFASLGSDDSLDWDREAFYIALGYYQVLFQQLYPSLQETEEQP